MMELQGDDGTRPAESELACDEEKIPSTASKTGVESSISTRFGLTRKIFGIRDDCRR